VRTRLETLATTLATPEVFLGFLAVAAVAIIFFYIRMRRLRYTKTEKLLTPMETRFYRLLMKVVGRDLLIFVKVRLGDLMDAHPGMDKVKRRIAFNKIACKHVDFVICDRDLRVLLGIELDDRSHEREDRKERDVFVDSAFRSAGINLLRVQGKQYYNLDVVKQQVYNALP
jgi:hypothetical protein